jgi:DNA polymerase-1
MFGRIRPITELQSRNKQAYEVARRAAINTPVQGTAADIIKLAMIRVHERLNRAGFTGGIVLQIHDELLLEIEEPRSALAGAMVRQAMLEVWDRNVHLEVDIGTGPDWAAAH